MNLADHRKNGMISNTNHNALRNYHRHAILDLVRFTPGGISRAELARQVGLTRSAVTLIINDLLRAKIVHETESRLSGSGRRPILLEINPQRGYVVGVDIGAIHLSLILADLAGRVVSEFEAPIDISQGPQVCLPQIHRHVGTLLEQAGISFQDVLTFGVGIPGPIAGDGGNVVAPPIMPGWDNFPIRDSLQEMWGCLVSLNNDAELGALGEWAYGAGRNERNLVYIKVGSGVGAGLILDNRIYRGATGTAGEIGHITIMEQGPLCTCGNRGCLEALAGGRAIAQQAYRAVQSGQRTVLASISPLDKITARDVTLAARRGDLVAQKIVTMAGGYLGTAIAGLINLLNPGMVVVGGGVAQAGDLLLEPIRKTIQERSLKAAVQSVRVNSAVLGRRSSSMGAVVQALTIVLHELSETPLR